MVIRASGVSVDACTERRGFKRGSQQKGGKACLLISQFHAAFVSLSDPNQMHKYYTTVSRGALEKALKVRGVSAFAETLSRGSYFFLELASSSGTVGSPF